ncbi:hypothetical protein ACG9X6_04590 [Acinetobacter guillouiae]|uniref:hypothetical protein n=1 Tax=Acinetobacter TaxID=469 RepID=UPI001FB88DBD|nr:hypothetical protein [Acinetobacter sp. NyZ410]UOH19235.1 hypothetical protein MTO68_03370 [Acinetobacter sp. NyZ410]
MLDFLLNKKIKNTGLSDYLKRIDLDIRHVQSSYKLVDLSSYFPNFININHSKDLIKAWYDYIFMIAEFIE